MAAAPSGLMNGLNVAGGIGGLLQALLGGSTNNTGSGTTSSNGWSNQNSNYSTILNNLLNTLQNTNQNTSQNQQQQTTGQTVSGSNLGPQQQQLLSQLTQRYSNLQPPSMAGYGAQQTQQINRNADLQGQAVNSVMGARGLASSPAAGTAQNNVEAQRIGNITQMQEQLPLLQNQLNLQNMGAAGGFLSSIPSILGQTVTNTGNTNVNGQTNMTGQQTGQQTQGQTSQGFNWGNSQQGQNSSSQNQSNNQQQGLLGMLGSLFSDKRLKEDIREIPSKKAVARVLQLRPKSWKWKDGSGEDEGFLAQDLEKVMPELVHKDPEGSGYLKVNYAGLLSELVGAVQAISHAQLQKEQVA